MENAWCKFSLTPFPAIRVRESQADAEDMAVWQHSRSFAVTNLHMLESGDLSDVTFRMGTDGKEIHAHKFMLASRSSVFFAMFCGSLAKPGHCVVEIPDIEHDIMLQLLRFLYTTECQVSTDSVMLLMYAAKKYDVPALMERCQLFLQSHLTPQNVCIILQQAHMLSEQDLVKQCMIVIFQNAKAALESDGFLGLDKQVVQDILKADFLVEEELLYKACLRWADEACTSYGKEVNDAERRRILGDLLYLIRFPCMSPETFTAEVSKANILTEEEKVSIFQFFIEHGKCKFVTKPRVHYMKHIIMIRFHNHQSVLVWGSSRDEIQFKCSENVNLAGVGLFLPAAGRRFRALLEVTQDDTVLGTKTIVPHADNVPFVMLDGSIPIQKDVMYGLALNVDYQEPSQYITYGVQGQAVAKCGNLAVTFSASDGSKSDCTDVRKGQFKCVVLEF